MSRPALFRISVAGSAACAVMALASCAPATGPIRLAQPRPGACDFAVAKDFRLPQDVRDHPPACALPTEEAVAFNCAIHDRISESGHSSLPIDEEGMIIDPRPLPDYRVSGLQCRFTDPSKNRASCRFNLRVPGKTSGAHEVSARFSNRYWRMDGPTSHMEGVRWDLDNDCTPEETDP